MTCDAWQRTQLLTSTIRKVGKQRGTGENKRVEGSFAKPTGKQS